MKDLFEMSADDIRAEIERLESQRLGLFADDLQQQAEIESQVATLQALLVNREVIQPAIKANTQFTNKLKGAKGGKGKRESFDKRNEDIVYAVAEIEGTLKLKHALLCENWHSLGFEGDPPGYSQFCNIMKGA